MKNVEDQPLIFKVETSAKTLAVEYSKKFNSYLNLSNIKNSKAWKFFYRCTFNNINDERWNEKKFVNFVYEYYEHYGSGKKVFPNVLVHKDLWERYSERYDSFKTERNSEELLLADIKSSLTVVKKWCVKNNKEFSTKEYFNNELNKNQLFRFFVGKNLCSVSKTFEGVWKRLSLKDSRLLMSMEEINTKRMLIFRNKELKSTLKKILKEDLVEFLLEKEN